MWLVELAPVRDAEAVPDAIAAALGITPQGGARVIDTVAEAVAEPADRWSRTPAGS